MHIVQAALFAVFNALKGLWHIITEEEDAA